MKEHFIKSTNSTDWHEMLKKLNIGQNGFATAFCLTYMDNIENNNKRANKILVEKYQNIKKY